MEQSFDIYTFRLTFTNGTVIPEVKIITSRSDPELNNCYVKIYLENEKGKKGLDMLNKDFRDVLKPTSQYFFDVNYIESPLVIELRRQIKELTDGWAADREAWKIEKAELLEIISVQQKTIETQQKTIETQQKTIETQQVTINELQLEVTSLKSEVSSLKNEISRLKNLLDANGIKY
ncbi:hypothetical protein SCHIN_v1c00660 [Spiroplasma chinense]|uniref:Uncharacterized protein n=1 Tax=Spiroplasma chinense TaxID=216932 RepID=A0A5B9Y2H3_9MOLU|nr:hypothetical protein [Spiroplasma chinense]QEH61264.1 hypothetical protein SCHIN_v1c00660 [Spiroplasma chinense]